MVNERPRIAGIVTTFEISEINGYRYGREAFLEMVACELLKAAGEGMCLEFTCTPRYGDTHFEMRAKPVWS